MNRFINPATPWPYAIVVGCTAMLFVFLDPTSALNPWGPSYPLPITEHVAAGSLGCEQEPPEDQEWVEGCSDRYDLAEITAATKRQVEMNERDGTHGAAFLPPIEPLP